MSGHPEEALTLLAAGELPPPEAREVEAHLAACPSCLRRYEAIRAALDRIEDLPPSEASFSDFLARRECDSLAEALTVHAYEGGDRNAEDHLAHCSGCAATFRQIGLLRKSFEALPPSRAAFDSLRPRLARRFSWRGAAAAALLFGVLGASWFFRGAPPAPTPTLSRMETILAGIDSVDESSLEAVARGLDRQCLPDTLELARAVEDTDSLRSYAAVRILRHLSTPAAEDLLIRAMGKNAARDRVLLRALVELQSSHVMPLLLTRLGDPARRAEAIQDLVRLGDPSTIGSLADCLDEPGVGDLLARFPEGELIRVSEKHRKAALFVRIPLPGLHAQLAVRAKRDASFRDLVLEEAVLAGATGVEFLLRTDALEVLRAVPAAVLERGIDRALDQADLAGRAIRAVGEFKLDALLPELRHGIASGRFRAEDALPILARRGDRETLIWIALLRTDPRWGKAASAALAGVAPALREEAIAAADRMQEEKVIRGTAPRLGRFRRDTPYFEREP